MVILDPDDRGCTIYNDMMVTRIQGRPAEVCHEVLYRTCCGVDNYGRPRQIITIGLVMGNIGTYYKDTFINMQLQNIVEIKSKHIDCAFPVIERERK